MGEVKIEGELGREVDIEVEIEYECGREFDNDLVR